MLATSISRRLAALLLRVRNGRCGRWLRLALVLLALVGMIATSGERRLAAIVGGFDLRYGLAMLFVFLLALGLFALRWWLIAGRLGIQAPWAEFLRVLWLSQWAGEIGPPLLAGEWIRLQELSGRATVWRRLASQALDRGSGQVVLWLLALALLPLYLNWFEASSPLRLAGVGALLIAASVVALVAVQRLTPWLRSETGALLRICHPLRSPDHYLISLLLQVLLSANFLLAALGLGLEVDWLRLLALGPLLLLGVGSLPSLVSDWGKREVAALVVLAPSGLSPEQSLAVSLIYGTLQFIAAAPGGLWWGLGGGHSTVEGTSVASEPGRTP